MIAKPSDMTPGVDLTYEKGAGPVRVRRPTYADLLAPCNRACPAGEEIQAWLAKDYAYNELRYRALATMRPDEAEGLLRQAQAEVIEKYRTYEELSTLDLGPNAAQLTAAVAET
jgi:hypothetical protein